MLQQILRDCFSDYGFNIESVASGPSGAVLNVTWGVRMLRLALGVLFASVATLARAAELETTHLFGFTLGSDVNAVGEKEAESEAFGRFGKSTGTYSALSQALGVKFIPVQNFSIEPVVSVTRFDISGVPGLDDRRQLTYEAASLEMRYRLLNRE